MKKHLLWAFALLSAPAVYAQNSSAIQQVGESQTGLNFQNGTGLTGVITQTASPGSNSANQGYMIQNGTGHTATILQTDGSLYNRAGIGQEGTGTGNTALIQQIGSGGQGSRNGEPVYASGEGNWAGIAQGGSGNNAYVRQNAVGEIIIEWPGELTLSAFGISGGATLKNFAEIWQYGSNNGTSAGGEVWIDQSGSVSNRAEIFQGDDSRGQTVTGTYSTSYAVSGNGARIDQTNGSTENLANIRQFSNENSADVHQNDPTSTLNKTDIRQGLGDSQLTSGGNTAVVNQTTNSVSNTATVAQYGQQSNAAVYQYGFSGSSSNAASVSQSAGSSQNDATIWQDDNGATGTSSTSNQARIVQGGSTSTAVIQQAYESSQNVAAINQGAGAAGSTALIGQRQSVCNTAAIVQNLTATGSGNRAVIEQGTETGAVATSLSALIGQEGSANLATLLQTGTSHQAVINQYGNGNIVKGTASTTSTREGTFTDMAEQSGTGHSLIVTQTSPGGANTTISNTLDVQQTGTGSSLLISQTAETASNIMILRQSGISNQAIIQQNGMIANP